MHHSKEEGMLECWNDGMMGKPYGSNLGFLDPEFQYSSIPLFHGAPYATLFH